MRGESVGDTGRRLLREVVAKLVSPTAIAVHFALSMREGGGLILCRCVVRSAFDRFCATHKALYFVDLFLSAVRRRCRNFHFDGVPLRCSVSKFTVRSSKTTSL